MRRAHPVLHHRAQTQRGDGGSGGTGSVRTGRSTRKIEKLAKRLGIENLSRSQVNEMTKGLNEQAEAFRNRPLPDTNDPVLWVDTLYEKVRFNGRVISMAVLIVCSTNSEGKREAVSIESMLEESKESYLLFPNQELYVRLVTTYLIEYAEDWSVSRVYLSQQSLQGLPDKAA